MKLLHIIILTLSFSADAVSQAQPIDSDIEHTFASGSKSSFSKGWLFDEAKNVLISPEKDLHVGFVETRFDGNVEKLSLDSWKIIDPEFQYKVHDKSSDPGGDGWEKFHQINYAVPAKESRIVFSLIRVFKGVAYINLINGTTGAFERRGAQLQIALDGWKPSGLKPADVKKETLGDRVPKTFGAKEEKDFFAFASTLAKRLQVPGATIAIVESDKIVFQKALGIKELGKKAPITIDTPFLIGSTTKPLTTLMLAKLVDLQRIRWDTPVQSVLPSFVLADEDMSSKILIQHTACACTGMPRRDAEWIFETANLSGEDMVRQMSTFKPTTGFGETFQYSNQLVALGGYVGGIAYSKEQSLFSSYEKAMKELVFAPLGMAHSFVRPPNEISRELPSPHSEDFNGAMTPIPQAVENMVYSVAPAGSIWSTAGDLARYMMMELNNGRDESGKQMYSAEQIQVRRTPGVKINVTTSYGLGLVVENDRGLEVIGHGGGTTGFSSDMFFIPKDKVGMVVLANAGSAHSFHAILRKKLVEMLYGAEVKSSEELAYVLKVHHEGIRRLKARVSLKAKDTKWIEKFIGKYKSKDLGVIEVKKTSDGLVLDVREWNSKIGSAKEGNGDKLIAMVDAPWVGGWEFQVKSEPKRQLILDTGQLTYEFNEVEK